MTFLKCFSGITDPFMKEHGFKRKNYIYFKMNGDIIQAVSVTKRNCFISMDICCIPKYTYFGEYLFNPLDGWLHNESIFSIQYEIDYYTLIKGVTDEYLINVINKMFSYFTENIFPVIDNVNTIAACNILYSRVASGEFRDIIEETDLSLFGYRKVDTYYQLYEDYLSGKTWKEITDKYNEWITSQTTRYNDQYRDKILMGADFPEDIREAFVPEIMSKYPFLYAVKLFIKIIESESLDPIKEYMDSIYNESKNLFKKYLNFDI